MPLAMEGKTKTWNRDGGGIAMRTAFKNLSMILVIISLLMSASSAQNANVSSTTIEPTVRPPVLSLQIGMPEFNNYNADRITVSWSNHSLYSEQKAHYQFKASGPGVYSNCKICLKKRSFDRWGFFSFGYGRHGDDGCRSDCGECQSSDTNATCYIKAQVNSSYSIEVKLWANGSSDSSSHEFVSVANKTVTTKEYVWPFVTRNIFGRLMQEELNHYTRYREYPIKCFQGEFHAFKKITRYQILISDKPQSSSRSGNYKVDQIPQNGSIFQGTVVHDDTSLPDVFVFGKGESGRKFSLSPASRYYFIFRTFIDENFLDTRTFYFDTESAVAVGVSADESLQPRNFSSVETTQNPTIQDDDEYPTTSSGKSTDKAMERKVTSPKLPETDETLELTTAQLQRLVLLEQLKLIRLQQQEILERKERVTTESCGCK